MRRIQVLVSIICSWAATVSGASPDVSDIRSFVRTNISLRVQAYSNFWESIQGETIQATNLVELYERTGDGRSAYPVLWALSGLKAQGKTLDQVTLEFIKRVALKSTDKESVEPIATSLALSELGIDEAIDFGIKVSSKAGPRSQQVLMKWISGAWVDGGLNNHPKGDELVMASLSGWKATLDSPEYVHLEPDFVRMLKSRPYSDEKYVDKTQRIAVKLVANLHNMTTGPLFPLVYYLVNAQTNRAMVEQEVLGLVSNGPIERAKVILWILSARHQTNSMATNVLSRIEGLRPELSDYMKKLKGGEIDQIKGMQEPAIELFRQLYGKKSFAPE